MKPLFPLLCWVLFPVLLFSQSVTIQSFATGFSSPVDIQHAGDDRLFIVERGGFIRVLNADGTTNTTPFLDIDSQVLSGGERGLLGLAFHPNYTTNGYFYVYYTNNSGDSTLSRFTANPPNSNTVNANTEQILLTFDQPFSNHNGGAIAFSPIDGYLYIGSGDGGSFNDPGNRAQNTSLLLGKILRIDVDSGTPYGIPSDNPFAAVGNLGADEIWAYGLRNPWRISFDRSNGDLWIGDVGQDDWEEIDRITPSQSGNSLNLGWRCYEGNNAFNTSGCPPASTMVFPVAEYAISGNPRCSITGGYRYRGNDYPNFQGLYFFADYCSDEIGTLTQNGSSWDVDYFGPFSGNGFSTFGEDVNGELYIAGLDSGTVYKVMDPTLSAEEFDNMQAQIYPNPTTSIINVKFANGTHQISEVRLFDIFGKLVATPVASEDANEILLRTVESGLYILELTTSDQKRFYNKLIVK